MSTKALLNEWRNFLNETSDFDSDPMMSPEDPEELEHEDSRKLKKFETFDSYDSNTTDLEPSFDEDTAQIMSFFAEIDIDHDSEEAKYFFDECKKPENREHFEALASLCLASGEDSLLHFFIKAASDHNRIQNTTPVNFNEKK